MKVAMIGCGKLGLPCAEEMAREYTVKGFDVVSFQSQIVEKSESIKECIKDCDFIFVAVPTPHHPDYDGSGPTSHLSPKDFSYDIVIDVLTEIKKHITESQIIVLISTVLPGTVREQLMPVIGNSRFVYNPYLIAMGSVSWDMVNPEMVIIGTEKGEESPEAQKLIEFYKKIMNNNPPYVVGTWDEAECIKIFYNTFISTKLGLVNMIQDVAIKQGNINVDIVTRALSNATQRITGPKYMTAGMGDGGACHPRDNIALRYMAEKLSLGYDLFGAIMDAREKQARNMAEYLQSFNLPIIIVGKAYKPCVPYTDGSPSILVASFIHDQEVYYLDPETGDYPPDNLGAATYLLAHNYDVTYFQQEAGKEKEKLNLSFPENSVIVDPWRSYCSEQDNITIIHYGDSR